jgi:flagellar basal-body rod modification protein FlgD
MTTITDISNLTSTSAVNGTKSSTLDQAAFLKLMTTQLKTQDPFAPMDNQAMVAQMAQFSSVAGITEMNASLKTIASQMGGTRISDAASWIGHKILVKSDKVMPDTSGHYSGAVELAEDTSNLTLYLVNAQGQIVHSESFDRVQAGTLSFEWDGSVNGQPGGHGPLTMKISAQSDGQTIAASTSAWTSITGVQSPAGGTGARLITPNGLITPDAAIRLG